MRKQKSLYCLIILFLVFWIFNSGTAQVSTIRNQILIGARPMGMGEAFAAVADDGNTIFWNPAGLANIDRFEMASMHTNLFDSGLQNNYLSFIMPYSERFAYGVDWFNLGLADKVLDYSMNLFNFSMSFRLTEGFSLGMNIKRLLSSANFYGLSEGAGSGWGGDFGAYFSFAPVFSKLAGLSFGIMAQDLNNTKITYDNDVSEAILRRNIHYGFCYRINRLYFFEQPLLAMDWDDRIHIGTEFWLPEIMNFRFGFRAGVQKDLYKYGDPESGVSFGASINYQIQDQYFLNFDYAFTDHPALMNTSRLSLGFSFSLPTCPVKIDTVHFEDLYASLYPFHEDTTFGMVTCHYQPAKKIDFEIKVEQPDYKILSKRKVRLNPEAQPEDTTKSIELNPSFSAKILRVKGEEKVRANIEIKPKSLVRMKPERAVSNSFTLYGIGKINWANGDAQAAAFITPDDPVVRDFAIDIIQKNSEEAALINEPVTNAGSIFRELGHHELQYVRDARSTTNKKAIDTISYPRELLAKQQGDCDDTTVLLASLYQSVGIRTALASTPNHIFIMFDSGIGSRKHLQLALPQEMYCLRDERVWIPVETTWLNKSFLDAWEKGATEMNENRQNGDLNIIDVEQAWEKYRPIPIKTLESIIKQEEVLAVLGDENAYEERKRLSQIQTKYLEQMEAKVRQFPDSLQIRNKLAITYALRGELGPAWSHFNAMLEQDSTNFKALNNLGNLCFKSGILDSARLWYQKALACAQTGEDSNGIYLNLGTLFTAMEDEVMAGNMYNNVIRDVADSTQQYAVLCNRVEQLLGFPIEDEALDRAEKKQKTKHTNKNTVRKSVKQSQKKKISNKKSRSASRKGRLPADEIEDVFYWAY